MHKPSSPFLSCDEFATEPLSMPGFDSTLRSAPDATFGMEPSGDYDAMTIFDVSKFLSDPVPPLPLPMPQIKTPRAKPAVSIPTIFKPFSSVESTELTVQQLRAVLRKNQRKIAEAGQNPSFTQLRNPH
jgi:hypothetical protein